MLFLSVPTLWGLSPLLIDLQSRWKKRPNFKPGFPAGTPRSLDWVFGESDMDLDLMNNEPDWWCVWPARFAECPKSRKIVTRSWLQTGFSRCQKVSDPSKGLFRGFSLLFRAFSHRADVHEFSGDSMFLERSVRSISSFTTLPAYSYNSKRAKSVDGLTTVIKVMEWANEH